MSEAADLPDAPHAAPALHFAVASGSCFAVLIAVLMLFPALLPVIGRSVGCAGPECRQVALGITLAGKLVLLGGLAATLARLWLWRLRALDLPLWLVFGVPLALAADWTWLVLARMPWSVAFELGLWSAPRPVFIAGLAVATAWLAALKRGPAVVPDLACRVAVAVMVAGCALALCDLAAGPGSRILGATAAEPLGALLGQARSLALPLLLVSLMLLAPLTLAQRGLVRG
ncbi:MAG: hypothetical protein ACOYOJ_14530 [Alsobacter sp.]